jgi:hypothetical protein
VTEPFDCLYDLVGLVWKKTRAVVARNLVKEDVDITDGVTPAMVFFLLPIFY